MHPLAPARPSTSPPSARTRTAPSAHSGIQLRPPLGVPAPLTRQELERLVEVARSNPGGVWPLGRDFGRARNRHVTNRPDDLRAGLAGSYDWLEVDVRLRGGVPIAAHDVEDVGGLRIADWIQVAAASDRGVKLDFKDVAALEPALTLVEHAGIDDRRLLVNVRILGTGAVPLAVLRRIRARFPRAILSLSPSHRPYDSAAARAAVALASAVGGPVSFPLDAAYITADLVRAFRRGGRVSVWNEPRRTPVQDIASATARLRAWGVDGMIDLRGA